MTDTNFWDVILTACYLIYRIIIFGGAAYLIEEHDWSMWTFLLAIALASVRLKADQ